MFMKREGVCVCLCACGNVCVCECVFQPECSALLSAPMKRWVMGGCKGQNVQLSRGFSGPISMSSVWMRRMREGLEPLQTCWVVCVSVCICLSECVCVCVCMCPV